MRKLVLALMVLSIVGFLSATVHAGAVIVTTGADFENKPVYYLSLGTSLAAGVQADPVTGNKVVTDIHYPGLLAEIIGEDISKLRHENLGCPGETSDTFIDGGRCDYPHGSQLDEAVNFLRAHGKFTGLITIDLGANDVLQCTQGTIDFQCAEEAIEPLAVNLANILATLREVAGPDVPIVGMNYYNPLLVLWFQNPDLAELTRLLMLDFNEALEGVYAGFGVPVADVAGAFMSGDLVADSNMNMVPDSVELLCAWTWMCAFMNVHPNEVGYGVIAGEFVDVLPPIPISEPPRRR